MKRQMTEEQKARNREYQRRWRERNPDKASGGKASAEYMRKYHANYRLRNPWWVSFVGARQRCVNPKHKSYSHYGGRGIEFHLTRQDVEFLWERDKGHLLNDPSIDRINADGHYARDNCRFIELEENVRLGGISSAARRAQKHAPAREADGQKSAESHLTSNDVK